MLSGHSVHRAMNASGLQKDNMHSSVILKEIRSQVKKVSDASQSSSVVRVKSDTFPSTSSTPTTTNTCQVPSKITESIHLPATIPKSIPSNPPNSSSLGNTEVKQRHIIAASSSEPTNAGINPKHSPLGTTKSKLQILPRRHK
ncbi:unnamed protein product [Trichobilharzia regenti]|nr:unnamed protein product [Trichobilharzia regenti]